ncbi:hypothetical protein BD310DRAFT_941969 [Dichomitus squalens]|uniref:Uncharacterized protein n=1 Tax=Dichomitus squalens TaxID=114155 RepID=A0A4Q9PA66_9APHY|nr:hypothetical protein BD310DRAFT_941969 [Dichomitus squalens]
MKSSSSFHPRVPKRRDPQQRQLAVDGLECLRRCHQWSCDTVLFPNGASDCRFRRSAPPIRPQGPIAGKRCSAADGTVQTSL